jgi:hypothetical protein
LSGVARSADAAGESGVQIWSFRPLDAGPTFVPPQRPLQLRSRAIRPYPSMRRAESGPSNSALRGYRAPLLQPPRAGARKAVPITRGTELGFKFRPDERDLPYGQSVSPGSGLPGGAMSPEMQSQFRPIKPRRKPTYEELQAEQAPGGRAPPVEPVMPYPPMMPPLPGYWNRW